MCGNSGGACDAPDMPQLASNRCCWVTRARGLLWTLPSLLLVVLVLVVVVLLLLLLLLLLPPLLLLLQRMLSPRPVLPKPVSPMIFADESAAAVLRSGKVLCTPDCSPL